MSATLPNGTRNMASVRRYTVATHASVEASIANSVAIEGSARFTAEMSKGVKKAARETTINMSFLSATATVSASVSGCAKPFTFPYHDDTVMCSLLKRNKKRKPCSFVWSDLKSIE